jgi:hypothetical protein
MSPVLARCIAIPRIESPLPWFFPLFGRSAQAERVNGCWRLLTWLLRAGIAAEFGL